MATGIDCCCESTYTPPVNVPGADGADGAAGADGSDGSNAYTVTNGASAVPAAAGDQINPLAVEDSAWMVVGQIVVIAGPSHYQVISKPSGTGVVLQWLQYPGDVGGTTVIASGSLVSPAGMIGPSTTILAGTTPEGVTTGSPGRFALGTDTSLWIKETGTNTNTGWVKLIGMIMFLCSLLSLSAAQPPILRSSLTTNTEVVGLTLVTNIARTTATNVTTILPTMTNIVVNVSSNNLAAMGIATNVNVATFNTNIVKFTITNSFPLATNKSGLSAMFLIVDPVTTLTNQFWYTNGILYLTNRYVF